MNILGFIVVIGITLVIFYLFLRKLFNEDRLIFPDEKPHPGKKHQHTDDKIPSEEPPQVPEEKQPEPAEKSAESGEKTGEPYDASKDAQEKTEQPPAHAEEIKM